jgi:hypothetical protein
MSSTLRKASGRTIGLALGAGLALALLAGASPGARSSPLPATVRVSMEPVGELDVTPASPRPILVADSLVPGGGVARETFTVRNQTAGSLEIRLRTKADSTALDGLVNLRLEAEARTLADTTLQGMQARTLRLDLESGELVRLRLQASIPRDILTGFEGRVAEVTLEPTIRITDSGR